MQILLRSVRNPAPLFNGRKSKAAGRREAKPAAAKSPGDYLASAFAGMGITGDIKPVLAQMK